MRYPREKCRLATCHLARRPRQPQDYVAVAFASARPRSSPDKLANERRNDYQQHECERREKNQNSGLFVRESASIDMCRRCVEAIRVPVLPEIAVARECNHFNIAKPSNGFLILPERILTDG